MKVIAYEHLETSPGTYINYFAVAVVKKNSNLTLATLKVIISVLLLLLVRKSKEAPGVRS